MSMVRRSAQPVCRIGFALTANDSAIQIQMRFSGSIVDVRADDSPVNAVFELEYELTYQSPSRVIVFSFLETQVQI